MSDFEERTERVLADLWPDAEIEFFTGNVRIKETVYDPSPSVIAALADVADSEFPAVKDVQP